MFLFVICLKLILSFILSKVTVTQEVGVEPDISPPTPSSEKREDELSSPTVTMPMTNQESEENCPLNETIILPVDGKYLIKFIIQRKICFL